MKKFTILLSFFLLVACTTIKPINLQTGELRKQISSGKLLKTGDQLKLITSDGKTHSVKATSISTTHIKGKKIEIPIDEIIGAERVEMNMGKTIALVAGIIVFGIAVNETADSLLEPVESIITNP